MRFVHLSYFTVNSMYSLFYSYSFSLKAVVPACSEGRHPPRLCLPWLCLRGHTNPYVWRHGGVRQIHKQSLRTPGEVLILTFNSSWKMKSKWKLISAPALLRRVAGFGRSWNPELQKLLHLLVPGSVTASPWWGISATCLEGWPMRVKTPMGTCRGDVSETGHRLKWCWKHRLPLTRWSTFSGTWVTSMSWSCRQHQARGPGASRKQKALVLQRGSLTAAWPSVDSLLIGCSSSEECRGLGWMTSGNLTLVKCFSY